MLRSKALSEQPTGVDASSSSNTMGSQNDSAVKKKHNSTSNQFSPPTKKLSELKIKSPDPK